ncbi:MAG: phosphate acyltransferase PlsX [Proteobacteria bacterium]|nr:phosphate acyltransferase PlsX [Pseudomonadota bacterium]MCH8096154.1 phosphate acyltransferase PlsX [Pseudomonadota bacterium]
MDKRLTIALDAMGGDRAPEVVIKGANIARDRHPEVDFLLFGDEGRIRPLLRGLAKLGRVCTLHHTEVAVSGEDKPSLALRNGRRSSMRLAIDAVHHGHAAGVVSAGNTGAFMAMAKVVLKTLPGIDRPAIASLVPTRRGESVMLDLGANIQCDAENLVQFAIMGEVYARTVLGLKQPTIALLNVGEEVFKGHEAVQTAAAILRTTSLPIKFHGFVEGDDPWSGTVDVVVTDGFTGNVAIKTAEGMVRLYNELLRSAFRRTALSRLGYLLVKSSLSELRNHLDARRYNGAMLLGLNGIAVKSHGGTDAVGFANAIGVAVDLTVRGLNDQIIEELRRVSEDQRSPQHVAAS